MMVADSVRDKDAAVPILLIAVGGLWLLWSLGWFPDLRTIAGWTLIAAGVLVMAIDGITRKSVVAGPFLIALGLFWFAHLEWRLSLHTLAPAGLIVLGVLMLVSRLPMIPDRRNREGEARSAGRSGPRPPSTIE